MDDYETGNFTATLLDNGGGGSYNQTGGTNSFYTRILNIVYFHVNITGITTSGVPNGTLIMQGLPFTSTAANRAFPGVGQFDSTNVTWASIQGLISGGSSSMFFQIQIDNTDSTYTNASSVNLTGDIEVQGFYFIDLP